MLKAAKFLTGLLLALGVGWLAHGPLGRGEAFVDRLDRDLQLVINNVEVPGVTGTVQRDPLARTTLYSGPANCFQRRGDVSLGGHSDGSLPGLDQRALTVPGMARVVWANPPPGGETCP